MTTKEYENLTDHVSVENNIAIIIADLMFAYINKDEDFPHGFEVDAFEDGYKFLKAYYVDRKYSLGLFENILKDMKDKTHIEY